MSETPSEEISVLIVEQEPAVLILLSSMLESNGFRVLLARSAEEATEIASRPYVPIHVLLSDVEFVAGSGPLLIDTLRAERPKLGVVYISTLVDASAIRIRVMRQVGPRYFAQETQASLVEAVRHAVASPRLQAGA